jgi:hypothetical protein
MLSEMLRIATRYVLLRSFQGRQEWFHDSDELLELTALFVAGLLVRSDPWCPAAQAPSPTLRRD